MPVRSHFPGNQDPPRSFQLLLAGGHGMSLATRQRVTSSWPTSCLLSNKRPQPWITREGGHAWPLVVCTFLGWLGNSRKKNTILLVAYCSTRQCYPAGDYLSCDGYVTVNNQAVMVQSTDCPGIKKFVAIWQCQLVIFFLKEKLAPLQDLKHSTLCSKYSTG